MDLDTLLAQIRQTKPDWPQMNIKRLALFGSHATGTAHSDSDVDLLVEFIETPDFFEFVRTKERLEARLDTSVDLVTFRALKSPRQQHILKDAIDV